MKSINFYPLFLLLFLFPGYSNASKPDSSSSVCSIVIAQQISAYGGSDGIAKAVLGEGIAPFTYLWSNGIATQNAVNLSPGTYSVTITDATGTSCSSEITFKEPSKIENYIFEDRNGNGIQDQPDLPVSRVLVKLTDSNGTVLATTTSNDFGIYSFDGLMPGDYYINVEPSGDYEFSYKNLGTDDTIDNDFEHRTSSLITLSFGQYYTDLDAGLYSPGSIGDFIFHDINKNGIQDTDEGGIPDIAVTISGTDSGGQEFHQSTFSDMDGHYAFQGLRPGRYTLHFTKPQHMEFSPQAHGTNHHLDSDINPETGESARITVGSGFHIDYIDAGFFADSANISNFVFSDNNANGVLDSGDEVIENVLINLYLGDISNLVAQAQTDMNGFYSFQNLDQAYKYIVEFIVPQNYIVTTKTTDSNSGSSNMSSVNESDARTDLIVMSDGNNDINIYAGLIPLSLIAGLTYHDLNNDSLYYEEEDLPAQGIKIRLFQNKESGSTLIKEFETQSDGQFIFSELDPRDSYDIEFFDLAFILSSPPITGIQLQPKGAVAYYSAAMRDISYASISDYTFFDTNEDGIYDENEGPLSGVIVSLYLASDLENIFQETISDDNGYYIFEDLETNLDYFLKFLPPTDFVPTIQSSTDFLDNDDSSLIVSVFIPEDAANYSFNAGFSTLNPDIGEFVWFDINKNGIQDDGPEGVPDVVVDLIDFNKNEVIISTTTNTSGFYMIRNTPPGTYYLRYSNIPQNHTFTQKDEFIDGLDSDVNLNGKTDAFTVAIGQEDNLSYDAGLVLGIQVPVELVSFTAKTINKNQVQLNWITAKEEQNQKFVIERSTNGIDFHALGVKDGKGDSNETVSYNYVDKIPFFGPNYYRLKQVDFNGGFVYSEIKSAIIKANAKKEILVYPNPTPDFVYIQSASPLNQDVTVKLINDQGTELLSFLMEAGDKFKQIDLSPYPPGTYFVHVIYKNERNSMFKVFKIDY